jgi:serine-type D-Ala-D-Ala endopeptidase (penicillin-binding protein 7)
MVKLIFKRMMLFYVALTLVATPVELLAANKKSQKRIHASQKNILSKQSKHRVSSRYKPSSLKVTLRLRAARQAQIENQHKIMLGEGYDGSGVLQLASSNALIVNQNTGEIIYAKNTNHPTPIASITKLMTAMVTLDAKQSLDDEIYVSDEDVDYLKGTRSRLTVGSRLSRSDMLQLALMASENRAASALAHHFPGGRIAFVKAMNLKARELGLKNTHFADPTGLDSENVSTAEDLVLMVQAAYQYPEIRLATTSPSHEVYVDGREYPVNFNNTNGLVRGGEWKIGLSKTGFINEAGRCLVMQAMIAGEPMIIVLLNSNGKMSRIGDANRIRKWMEFNSESEPTTTGQSPDEIVAGRIS